MTPLNGSHTAFPLAELADVGEARRQVTLAAKGHGLDETLLGRAAIVVTEAANNVVKHGGGGELLYRIVQTEGRLGVELVALDKGPGMRDLGLCLSDGYSTGGTPGTGLGAIMRQADDREVQTAPGQGTAVLARLWSVPRAVYAPEPPLRVGGVAIAFPGETLCGDAWTYAGGGSSLALMVADGIGHGPLASDAARRATQRFERLPSRDPEPVLRELHKELRGTRGAAVAVAAIELGDGMGGRGRLRFAGIGNIAASVVRHDASKSLPSIPGMVGHEMRKVQEFTQPWSADGVLVMHSDGLATQWRLDAYPGLAAKDPTLIAAVLYRDFTRGRDDVSVAVVRAGRDAS